ncbi:MAG: Nif3-like dinuclear metal center hexameric protein [Planctomycetota bacterium]|nr:Nif3-like dinuclear metal center hexameric protein [Planctomycetota bacterium]
MASTPLASVIGFLESFAPLKLAEEWDNVGLLLGDRSQKTDTIMTCLTVTPGVVGEAIEQGAGLIVSHHPLPFKPLKKITADSSTGRMVLELCKNGIALFSPHTAFDSTADGINQSLADRIGLGDVLPIREIDSFPTTGDGPVYGVGRFGSLESRSCRELCRELKGLFNLPLVKFCGDLDSQVSRIAIACGSAGQFLPDAARAGCDGLITGETNYHTCLEALAAGVSLFLLGHYGSERFAVEMLAQRLQQEFPGLSIRASQQDRDPLQYVG